MHEVKLTIDEIQNNRMDLENKISRLINDFQTENNVLFHHLSAETSNTVGGKPIVYIRTYFIIGCNE